jgi:Fur family ferric uptake transcriptional regulator
MQEQLKKHLGKSGYSLTVARKAVFTALQNQEPLTMNEIVKHCGKIDRASVYRNVELFEHLGIAQRLPVGWKYKIELSAIFSYHHHHFVCSKCGLVIDMPTDEKLEERLAALVSDRGLKIQDHQIEIRGLCTNCQKLE